MIDAGQNCADHTSRQKCLFGRTVRKGNVQEFGALLCFHMFTSTLTLVGKGCRPEVLSD